MSSRPIRAHREDYLVSVVALSDLVRESGATPVIYTTWPYNEGASRLERLGISRDEMADQLRSAFEDAAAASGALVADVEEAFVSADPHEPLYAADGVHPSTIGSRLAAEVIARTIEADLQARSSTAGEEPAKA